MESYDAYVGGGGDLASSRPFDSDYMGFDPRLPSQRFDSFRLPDEGFSEEHYTQEDSKDLGEEEEDIYSARKEGTSSNGGFDDMGSEVPPPFHSTFDDELGDGESPSMSSTFEQSFESRLQPDCAPADDFSPSVDSNGKGFGHGEGFPHSEDYGYGFPPPGDNGDFLNGAAVLPPPDEMQAEEGFVLREWKRKNAIHLEEKARIERERLSQIIDAADSFKDAFYEKRKTHCETTKKNNREKEKVFLENLENFHATADKHYWKAVAELVPHELPTIASKSRGNKKPTVVVNHGPKPGKATDLTRMRQVLVKLKHNPPAHMKAPPPAPPAAEGAEGADAKGSAPAADTPSAPAPAPASAPAPVPVPVPAPAPAPAPDPAPLQKQGSIPTAAVA